jgi:calcineurin-like phosphoesterase family protein
MTEAMARLLRHAAVASLLALAACATTPPTHPEAFAFAVMGDTQYNAEEERAFVEMLERVSREDLAFVVHVGDFMGGVPCSDELYERRRREFDASAHPFIYTPGDNEWVDCRQRNRGGGDAAERLARLRAVFFADRRSLGRQRIETFAQDRCVDPAPPECGCAAYPENRFWSRAGVRFVTLNVPGSENNTGYAAGDAEARCRNEANAAWLERAVNAAERSETRALVILMQANPWSSRRNVYRALLRQVEDAARRVRKPVLLVHGDTHNQRIDTPFLDSLGNANPAIVRLETFGSPVTGWIKVTVDPDDPQVFRFEPRAHAITAPR